MARVGGAAGGSERYGLLKLRKSFEAEAWDAETEAQRTVGRGSSCASTMACTVSSAEKYLHGG